jgi:outer membrane usher protein
MADPAAATALAQRDTLVVRIVLNTEDKGDYFVERAGSDFLVKTQDLKAIGFPAPPGSVVMIDGEPYISLRSMPGVTFAFQEKELALNITALPQLLPAQNLSAELRRRARGLVPTNNSAFANYAFTATGGDSVPRAISFAGEGGWRLGNYLFQSSANTIEADLGRRKLVRLMSSITHDDRQDLRRIVVGDLFTPARDLSTGVNLGGLSVSKVFGLNPYFIQSPTQSIAGNVSLPTDLEVYLDGQRIRSERIRPGEFELTDIIASSGARNVQVVLRDSFGRVQQLDYSFYVSDQPLALGLHEYSYNIGVFRKRFGLESIRYGSCAFNMFHRYGLSNSLTLGLRAEGTRDLLNIGPVATAVLGSAGVISVSAGASSIAGRRGIALQGSYGYQAKKWTVGVWGRLHSGEYATLGDPPVITNRRAEGAVTVSYFLPRQQSVSFSHSFLTTQSGFAASSASATQPFHVAVFQDRRVTALSYSVPAFRTASLTASMSHIKDAQRGSRNEVFVGISAFFDNGFHGLASYRADRRNDAESIQFTKTQPVGEGLGFVLTGDRERTETDGSNVRFRSTAQYNAPVAVLRADLGNFRDSHGRNLNDYRLSVAGGVGYAADTFGFGRPIIDSFGIVKVGEVPDVAVALNGQPMGKTTDKGIVFIPTLGSYVDNEVTLSGEMIPIEYSLPTLSKKISPSFRSGAVIDFSLNRVQAFSGRLRYPAEVPGRGVEPREIELTVAGRLQRYQTGRGGEFYLENLTPGTYRGRTLSDGKSCIFELIIPMSKEMFVDLGEVVCRFGP